MGYPTSNLRKPHWYLDEEPKKRLTVIFPVNFALVSSVHPGEVCHAT